MESIIEYKKLINGKGFYARINLEASSSTKPKGLDFTFDVRSKWYNTAFFAASYYFEHLRRKGFKELNVNISFIEDQIVDTSQIVVVYVVLLAIENSLGNNIIDFEIDDNGNLKLPK